ncbi:MAG: hypothetical protein ACOWWO_04015 [Peptococcaceae bacterium]
MLSPDYLNTLLEAVSAQLNEINREEEKVNHGTGTGFCLTPSQTLVILGLLGGVLSIESILVDKDQTVNIVLEGTLKRKSKMDKILDQMGHLSFEEVMKALFERFG